MMERLTGAERQIAFMICAVMAIVGLVMAAAGRGDPMGSHGAIVLIAAGITTFFVMRAIGEPEPAEDRTVNYYDDPTKARLVIALFWAVVGMGMGVWVAAQLAWPDLRFDAA